MTQPEALRLADALEMSSNHGIRRDAAAELRRLYAQRDALLEALKKIEAIEDKMFGSDWEEIEEARDIARAAIKAAEDKQ